MSLAETSLKSSLSRSASISLALERLKRKARQNREQAPRVTWPEVFVNQKTGKVYEPHNDEEYRFVYEDGPWRYGLLKGGEGGGKSTAGTIKDLNRVRRGMPGILVSPDLEHFKKSLWLEFINWCPVECVIPRHRYRFKAGWEPTRPFMLVLISELQTYTHILCGGIKESEAGSWEGPNINWVHADEMRRHRTAAALKVLDGRARIPGPGGEPPQLYFTTTPRKHWLYNYFGPVKDNDPHAAFKKDSYVATVLTEENRANLEPGFVERRAQSLNESEARVLLKAEWEDETDTEKFVQIIWWDACAESLPPLSRHEPMVIALDAAKGGEGTTLADCFAVVAVTRHPANKDNVAVRYCGIWQPAPGQLLDFGPIKEEIRRLCREFSVIEVCYDPTQLHDTAMTMQQEGVALFKEFSQQLPRLKADKRLQSMIAARQIAHDGNPLLRQHIDNSYIRKHGEDGIRIVKRTGSLKIDAAVALSMANDRIKYYNI